MKKGADWIAWTMQAIAGFLVGAIIGGALVARGRTRSPWIEFADYPLWLTGAGLIGAAFASYIGDRIWSGESDTYHRLSTLADMRHSRASKILSWLVGLLGLVLMASVIIRHLGR